MIEDQCAMLPYVTVRRRAFVAHRRIDAAMVQALGVVLLEFGWRLNDVIPYVEGWEALAVDAIEEADAFILMATPSSLQSGPCLFEWTTAAKLNKPMVRLDVESGWDHLVPAHLAGQSSVVVRGSADQYVKHVVNVLAEACSRNNTDR